MFSIIDLIISFSIALSFVIMFKIHRMLSPENYFATTQLIIGTSITIRMVIIRIIMVFGFGLLSYFFIRDTPVVLLGVLIGSLLIVWPVFLAPSQVYFYSVKKTEILIIFLSHLIFVIASFSITYLSINFFPVISDYTIDNFIHFIRESIVWLLFTIIGYSVKDKVDSLLEKRIDKNRDEIDPLIEMELAITEVDKN